MKKQFLSYNNDAVENNVIAQHLSELTEGQLKLENPENLIHTNQILRTMGLSKNRPNNNNGKNKNNQNNKNKFKKKY